MSRTNANESRYFSGYLGHERWLSYVHQISVVADLNPCSIIEIGVGPGVKGMMARATFPECQYTAVDIDPALGPDVSADVRRLPFADDSFEVGYCCQVLEHIPYADFLVGLSELRRICGCRVVISLPDVTPFLYLRARPPSSRRILPWLWKGISLPSFLPKPHNFDDHGQHYWEIGKRGYSLRRILDDIRTLQWHDVRHFRMIERSYWHFFVLDIAARASETR